MATFTVMKYENVTDSIGKKTVSVDWTERCVFATDKLLLPPVLMLQQECIQKLTTCTKGIP